MKLIGHRTIQLSVILSFLLLSGCSQNVVNTDNFEKNYDFDVYDHMKVPSLVISSMVKATQLWLMYSMST